ncbi:MAG TPA: glycosyltransferase family 39 protein [Thermoleophilaceae bacterium]|jgi:4-amino-4-deoxy-L-arabinose transferase-like glycosyltransferase
MRRLRKSPFAARLLVLAGVGLAARLVYALVVMHGRPVTGDGREFHLLANVLGESGRYLQPFLYLYRDGTEIPTAEKPPLYPLVLALPSALGLDTNTAHQVVSCLMGAAAVALIGLLGRRVGGDRVGLVAAAVASVYPALVMLDFSLRSESLYVPLVALCLLAAYRLADGPSPRRAALLGLAVGLAALTRGEAVLLLALLAVPVLWLVPRPRRLALAAAVAAGFLAVVGPWLARNWITFDRPAAISTNEGGLIAGANCRSAYHTELIGTWACFPEADPAWGTNEALISSRLRRRGLDYAGDHAGRVPAVVGVRVMRVWDVWSPRRAAVLEAGLGDRHIRAQQASTAALYLLAPLAVVGGLVLRRRGQPLRVLAAPLLLVTIVAAATYGTTRFRAAAEVPIVVLASVGISGLWERRR